MARKGKSRTPSQSSARADARMERAAREIKEAREIGQRLEPQYTRVVNSLENAGLDRLQALRFSDRLQEINTMYSDGEIDLDERDELFFDDIYEPLEEEFEIDFHETYEKEQ